MRKKPAKGTEKLEKWQKDDAARLAELFQRTPLSQEAFGAEFGIGTQGAVSQYLNGLIPLNLTAALRFAKGLGVSVSAFSPTLGKEIEWIGNTEGAAMVGALRVLDSPGRAELLNFFEFKLQNATVAEDVRAHYVTLIKQLKEQLPLPFEDASAANDTLPAHKVRSIKGRRH